MHVNNLDSPRMEARSTHVDNIISIRLQVEFGGFRYALGFSVSKFHSKEEVEDDAKKG